MTSHREYALHRLTYLRDSDFRRILQTSIQAFDSAQTGLPDKAADDVLWTKLKHLSDALKLVESRLRDLD